ncbi:MAG: efflux RND transporter periplasmic adaptor subunit [Syntrophobacteraceae bacterium]
MISVLNSTRMSRKDLVGCAQLSPPYRLSLVGCAQLSPPYGPASRFLLLISCFLILLFPAGCTQKQEPAPPPPPKVTVSQPVRENVTDYLELNGNTQAVNTVQLRARVEGYLDAVYFNDGDVVKKDQLLFLIQQNTYFAMLQQAEGNVLNQKSLLEHAKTEFARYTKLYEQKAAADTDVENWRNQRDTAQAGLLSAEAQRDLAKLNLVYTWVVAPFAGRMDRRLVDPGNLVGSGTSTVLAELTQIDPLYVYFTIAETAIPPYLRDVRAAWQNSSKSAAKAEKFPVFLSLSNEEGYPHEGYLDFTANTVTSTTGTLLVRGVFPNPDSRMRPGEYAKVRLPVGKERSAILVPQSAVGYDQLGNYVMIVNEKNTVERRNVKTGAQKDHSYVIEEGLNGDEWVVTIGLLKAIPGKLVTPQRAVNSE